MNNEKVEALFNSVELLIDEQKKATHELNRATNASMQLKKANSENENIRKVVNDFRAVQTNSKKLVDESCNAVNRTKDISTYKSWFAFFILSVAGFLVGGSGGYAVWEYKIKNEILKENTQQAETKYKDLIESHFGVTIDNSGIYSNKIQRSESESYNYYIPKVEK